MELGGKELDPFFEGAHGGLALLDRKTHRILTAQMADLAGPPGSTLKPLVLQTLLERGRLGAEETFPCVGDLGWRAAPSPARTRRWPTAMTVRTAIAYSCNCFVAHFAARFAPGELTRELEGWGLEARNAPAPLQALGEEVVATPASLAAAFMRLAAARDRVKQGMADAVALRHGAARTGYQDSRSRERRAARAMPPGSRDLPNSVVIAVLVQGRSGGADAAPVAARILEAHARAAYEALTAPLIRMATLRERYVYARCHAFSLSRDAALRFLRHAGSGARYAEGPAQAFGQQSPRSRCRWKNMWRPCWPERAAVFRSDEAMKAMAVAARTFAVYSRGRHAKEGYDLCGTRTASGWSPAR